MAKTHKFGVIYQQFGQTCEEELFGNIEHPESIAEFLNMLGDKVDLKGFEGYVSNCGAEPIVASNAAILKSIFLCVWEIGNGYSLNSIA